MNQQDFISVIEKFTGQKNILAVPRILVEITPTLTTAFVLSQLIYWSGKSGRHDNFFYKSAQELADEIGISVNSVRRSKDKLTEMGLIETVLKKANSAPTTHYRIKFGAIFDLLKMSTSPTQNEQMDLPNMSKSITDITTETTKASLFPSGNKSSAQAEEKSFLSEEFVDAYNQGLKLNKFWKSTGLRRGHDNLESKFLVKGKYGGTDRKTQPVWAPVTSAIRNVGLDTMMIAVQNYAKYCEQADEYTPLVGLSLAEFCHNTTYKEFIEDIPEKTKKYVSDDPWEAIRKQFQPLTSVYTEIFDDKKQRYYGFKLDKINSDIRFEDVMTYMDYDDDVWTFDNFMELEWMIAGFLWRRKRSYNSLEPCLRYLEKWKDLIPRFKKEAKRWLKEDWELYG